MTDPTMPTGPAEGSEVQESEVHPKSAPDDRETAGPLDESEANPVRPYIDLGGVKILPRPDLHLRLEVEEATKRVVAVGLDYAESTLQVQPFAAPRTGGLWYEIRAQIIDQIHKQGGTTRVIDGTFGPEVQAQLPANANGQQGTRLARFVGVDGPRWFLRGVIAGAAIADGDAAAKVEDLYRSIVVVRGQHSDAAARPHPAAHARWPGGSGVTDEQGERPEAPPSGTRSPRRRESPGSARSSRARLRRPARCCGQSAACAASSSRSCRCSGSSSSTR